MTLILGERGTTANETITLTTWGRKRHLIEALILEAMEYSFKQERGRTSIYMRARSAWQKQNEAVPKRSLKTVFLPVGVKEALLSDVEEFLNSARWYVERGIPYHRGYLLHGPPGTGKTSLVSAMAAHLDMSIAVINLNNADVDDNELLTAFTEVPTKRCLLLIEDIDAALASRTRNDIERNDAARNVVGSTSKVTLVGLLNAIDGVSRQHGRLLFITTNHLEMLDAALTRPGRIDVKVELGLADRHQIQQIFSSFHPAAAHLANSFAALVPDKTRSMAAIQAHLVRHKGDPAAALADVQAIEADTIGRYVAAT